MLLLLFSVPLYAEPPLALPVSARGFIDQNCVNCHEGSDAEAGLDLKALDADLSDETVQARWVRIFDRVHDGEMPPTDADKVDSQHVAEFLNVSGDWLQQHQNAVDQEIGRVRGRRLTRREIERSLHDLLGIEMTHSIYSNFRRKLHRRTILRGAGVGIAVPWLTAMTEAFAGPEAVAAPRRFVSMTLGLGLHADNLNPEGAGRDYKPSPYLQRLQDIRERITVISGSSHPGVSGGHRAEASLLSAAPMGSGAASRNSVSLDQLMAKHLGDQTRIPSLVLGQSGSNSPSYTENGSMIPAESSPAKLFTRLFVNDTPEEQKLQAQRAKDGRSIMNLVADDAGILRRQLGAGDRERLDAYFSSVRDLEVRPAESEAWIHRPKPKVVDESEIVYAWGDFLRQLQQTPDSDGSLLDNTSVLLTSNLGNASSHDNRNMPVLVAGGRFRHGQHLAFDQKRNYPLPNLYVSLLQHTGLEFDRFATSTGTMTGLEST